MNYNENPNRFKKNSKYFFINETTPARTYSNILSDDNGELLYCSVLKVYEPYSQEKQSSLGSSLDLQESPFSGISITEERQDAIFDSPTSACNFSFHDLEGFLIPKGLVILSKQPLFNTFEQILLSLYKLSKKTLTLPMECYISHMILQVPQPSYGHVVIRYLLGHHVFALSLPPSNKLPVLDINLGILFNSLDLDNILIIFRNILLEKSTVFISDNDEKLMACTYAMISLIFPMHWNNVYLPILPCTLLDYLYSPVTFLFGVHANYIEDVFERVNDSVCIVDLDNNRFLISKTPAYHRKSSAHIVMPKLPDHCGKKLKKNLENTLTKNGITKGKTIRLAKPKLDKSSTLIIRSHFFKFFVSILQNYKEHIIFEAEDGSSNIFNMKGFIQCSSDKDFMNLFTETKIFASFIQSRKSPKNATEQSEGMLFDEEIMARDNMDSPTRTMTFLYDSSHDHHTTYTVPSLDTFFKSTKDYSYENFPDFDHNIIRQYQFPHTKPPRYAETIDKKILTAPIWRTNAECLLTCWMDLWGLFIYMQDYSEHNLRMHELINVADHLHHNTTSSTISLYKYLLEKCYETHPALSLPLLRYMNSIKIQTDTETLHILQKIVSKIKPDDYNGLMQRDENYLNELKQQQDIKKPGFRRVFTKPGDINVFAKQEISFVVKETCKKCGRVLKADDIALKWSKAKHNYESACVTCDQKILPKLIVCVGIETGYHNEAPTSIKEETHFISPQALRQLVNDLIALQKNLELEQFRCGYSMIFWNAVYYFYINKLPYEFLLMYDNSEPGLDNAQCDREIKEELYYCLGDKTQMNEHYRRNEHSEQRYMKFINHLKSSAFA